MIDVEIAKAEEKFEQLKTGYQQADRTQKWNQTTAMINFAYVQAAQENKSYFGKVVEFFQSEVKAAGSTDEKRPAITALQETVFGPQASRAKLDKQSRVAVVDFVVDEATSEVDPVKAKQLYEDLFENLSQADGNDQRDGNWGRSIDAIVRNMTPEDENENNPKAKLLKLLSQHNNAA